MNVLRYYSLLWLAIPILVIIAAILVRNKARPVEWLAYGGVTLALVAAWLALRPVATPLMGEAADIQKQIGAGTPVLLEFQSPY